MATKYIILIPYINDNLQECDKNSRTTVSGFSHPEYSFHGMRSHSRNWVTAYDTLDEAKQFLFPASGIAGTMSEINKWKMTCCIAECEITGDGNNQWITHISKLHHIDWLVKSRDVSNQKRISYVKQAHWAENIIDPSKVNAGFLELLTERIFRPKKYDDAVDDMEESGDSYLSLAFASLWSGATCVFQALEYMNDNSMQLPFIRPAIAAYRYFNQPQAEPDNAIPQLEAKPEKTPLQAEQHRIFAGNPKRRTEDKNDTHKTRHAVTLTHF